MEKENINSNKVTGLKKYFIIILAAILSIFHLITSGYGTLSALDHRLVHWILMFILIFLLYPSKKKSIRWIDLVFIILVVLTGVYLMVSWRQVSLAGVGSRTTFEIFLFITAVLITLEGTRRTVGLVLPITACIFLLYLFVGPWLPDSIGHHGYSMNRIATIIYFGTEGIYGTAIQVSSTIIIVFVMFGSLLNSSGGGKYFIDLAYSLVGRYRGGSAKTAVISSALMGTISGSPIANVVTTGTFTIPLMKRSGYDAHVAGAVEAVASTGGQIMPPIMGAAAFIMAEFTNTPYATIAFAAFIPALLYFFSIYMIVDIEAIKHNIKGIPKTELPNKVKTLKEGWYLLLPLVTLIYFIMTGFSVTKSVYYSILILIIVWLIHLKFNFKALLVGILESFEDTAKSAASVVSACACAGIIVGTVQLTGLGLRLSSLILVVAQNNLLIGLIFSMIAALIMGMGLPTTVLYIILSTIAAPALIHLGLPVIVAHLFVFYFGCMSSITPPVALAAFGASGIAGASSSKIGFTAFKFGLVAFIIPFMFVYSPGLLFNGTFIEIITVMITSIIGTTALAYAIQNWLYLKTNIFIRLMLFTSALLLIKQGLYTDIAGVVIFSLTIAYQKAKKNKITQGKALKEK